MRRTFVPYLALTAVLLAGCSGKPAPREPDSTGSASPEATATPPPLPEAATQETAEGAASFVDHYLDVLNYASQTGDTTLLQAVSRTDCDGCTDYIRHYQERAEAGGRIEGGEFSAGDISVGQYGTDTSLQTELLISAGFVVETAESDREEFDASTETVTFVARYEGGAWKMAQFVPGGQQ